MNKSKWLLLLFSLVSGHTEAQTFNVKGSVASYNGLPGLKVHIAWFDGNEFSEIASSELKPSGEFEIKPAQSITSSACLLWFDSGDTVSFVAGSDKLLEFSGRWYEGMVVEMHFPNSAENTLFRNVKDKLKAFRSTEDSINLSGMGINEFDPMYSFKVTAIKDYFKVEEGEFNHKLRELQRMRPESYCAKSIIPVLLRNYPGDDSVVSKKYDNNRSFQHYEFFNLIKNDSLITTNPFLREKIYDYMNVWVNQQDKGLQGGIDEVMKKFGSDEALSKYALAALLQYFTGRNNYPIIDYLYANYFNTCEVPALKGRSAEVIEQLKRLARGNNAPELAMPDINGNYFLLSQMKPRSYVVILFWASWCPHCQKEMPEILNYYHQMRDKGVDFIGVSLDDKKSDWLDYIKQNKLDWTNISDLRRYDSEAIKLYALRGTPTFFVLDDSLKIVGRTNDLSGLKALIK